MTVARLTPLRRLVDYRTVWLVGLARKPIWT
jgi:hypothetical protein